MDSDDDIAVSLPLPPPPAPARRDAAIEEALRRFDGASDSPPAAGRARRAKQARWWGSLNRPQTGGLVAAALVALIGAPIAWRSIDHRSAGSNETMLASAADSSEAFDVPLREPSVALSPPMMSAPASPSAPVADSAAKRCPTGDCSPSFDARARQAPVLADDGRPLPSTPAKAMARDEPAPPPREVQLADAAMPRMPAAMIAAAPAPPPPPAAVAPIAEDAMAADIASIVVTGQRVSPRRSVGRGDWNACTVDDPRRSLSGCRKLVDPAAHGADGRASVHVADGLSLAWNGDLDGAIARFDKAVAIAPRLAVAYLNRGLAYQRKGDLTRAVLDLDRAVRAAPRAARGYYARSVVLRQRGDALRADRDRERAVELDPRYAGLAE